MFGRPTPQLTLVAQPRQTPKIQQVSLLIDIIYSLILSKIHFFFLSGSCPSDEGMAGGFEAHIRALKVTTSLPRLSCDRWFGLISRR